MDNEGLQLLPWLTPVTPRQHFLSVLKLCITLGWCQPKKKRQRSSRCMATPTKAGNSTTIASFYISYYPAMSFPYSGSLGYF